MKIFMCYNKDVIRKGVTKMLSLKELKEDTDLRTQDGFLMDALAKETMKALDLKFVRSAKNRMVDRKKAVARFGKSVDLTQYAIHHCYNGLVGLVPRTIHESIKHRGYFYRLAN